tara:strand:- start:908 stop:1102 length:195 start_codon:yes stop_codon:yes gene_type:complete
MLKKIIKKANINNTFQKTCIPKKEIITTQIEGIDTIQFKNRMDKIKKRYYLLGDRLIKNGWYYR